MFLAFIGRQCGSDNVERKFVARKQVAHANNYRGFSCKNSGLKERVSKVTKRITTTPSEPLFYFFLLYLLHCMSPMHIHVHDLTLLSAT